MSVACAGCDCEGVLVPVVVSILVFRSNEEGLLMGMGMGMGMGVVDIMLLGI